MMARAAAIALVWLLYAAAPAHAYPHWQFSSGTNRCSSCHYAPSGGGLLSDYGRYQAGDELSSFGGDGALLHGVGPTLPGWLDLGGDLRGALIVNDVQDPDGAHAAVFPMQAELAARLALPGSLSIAGTVGLRGQVRRADELVPDQNFQPVDASQLISREHFVTWQPESPGPYVKLGRFYAPFGLRLPEHVFYVRRDLGFNFMEESYNLSVGWHSDRTELDVTAFMPDELRHMGGTEWGGAVSYQRHIVDDRGAVGGQAKLASGVGVTRAIGGAIAKLYLPAARALVVAEADLVWNRFDGAGATLQLVSIAGVSLFPLRGTVLSLYGEHEQTDLRVSNARWEAGSVELSWFPVAHVELQALGRLQLPAGGDLARTLLVQLHYYL